MPLRKLFSLSAFFSLICLVSPLLLRAYVQEAQKTFTILLSGPTSSIKAGTLCEVGIKITNVSNHKIAIRKENGGYTATYYTFSVLDGTGHTVVTRNQKEIRGVMRSSFQFKRLEPKETFTETVNLSNLLDLSKPGDYKVRVSRDAEPDDGGGHVDSNEIDIKVIP